MVSATIKARVARLSLHASNDVLAKVRFVDFVATCCDAESSVKDIPGRGGSIGEIIIRAASRAKYCTIRDQLAAEGWLLLEG